MSLMKRWMLTTLGTMALRIFTIGMHKATKRV